MGSPPCASVSKRETLDLSRNGRARLTELRSAVGNGGFVGPVDSLTAYTIPCAHIRRLGRQRLCCNDADGVGVSMKVQCPAESLCVACLESWREKLVFSVLDLP